MILTSNRGFAEWGDIFGSPVVATALLDRLLHHAIVIQIEGSSYGMREHADLLPETVRFKPHGTVNPIPPTLKRRGQPPKNGGADHAHARLGKRHRDCVFVHIQADVDDTLLHDRSPMHEARRWSIQRNPRQPAYCETGRYISGEHLF